MKTKNWICLRQCSTVFLFFKTFLTKEATDVIPEISESFKLQLHDNNKDLTGWLSSEKDLYNEANYLYNDILILNGCEDKDGDNFKLNYVFMVYIKIHYQIYVDVLRDENLLNEGDPNLDFFNKVFNSFFFFKNFLTDF